MTRPPNAPEPLDLARLALVMAHLRRFPRDRKGEVLRRLGVDERAWEIAVTTWAAARDAELARGATDLTRRFGVAFGRALKRLEKDDPGLDALRPLGDPPPAPSPEPPLPVQPPTPPVATPPPVSAPPAFVPPPVVAPPAAVAAPAFVPPPAVAAPAFVPPAAAPAGRHAPTLHLVGTPAARLPFVPAGAAGGAFEAAVAHALAVQGPAPAVARLGQTVGLSEARPAFGETVGPTSGVAEAPRAPPGVPDLTLPQYASLRADVQMSPDKAEAILARYGVARDGRPALDAHWRSRFEADPLLRMMFAKAYATYVAWLKGSRA